jgi:hypothetical protein
MAVFWQIMIWVAGGVLLFQIVRYAVKQGTLEALRQFRKEGGFAPADKPETAPKA